MDQRYNQWNGNDRRAHPHHNFVGQQSSINPHRINHPSGTPPAHGTAALHNMSSTPNLHYFQNTQFPHEYLQPNPSYNSLAPDSAYHQAQVSGNIHGGDPAMFQPYGNFHPIQMLPSSHMPHAVGGSAARAPSPIGDPFGHNGNLHNDQFPVSSVAGASRVALGPQPQHTAQQTANSRDSFSTGQYPRPISQPKLSTHPVAQFIPTSSGSASTAICVSSCTSTPDTGSMAAGLSDRPPLESQDCGNACPATVVSSLGASSTSAQVLHSSYGSTAVGASTCKPAVINFGDYVSSSGPFTKFRKFFFGQRVLVSTKKGADVNARIYRHAINMFKSGKSWGGKFSKEHLKVRNGKEIFIDLKAEEPSTPENLVLDLGKITDLTLCYYKADGKTAIWVGHLRDCCKNPPQSIYTSERSLKMFLEFIYYHLCFAHPIDRSDLVKGIGMLLKYCSTCDVNCLKDCMKTAGTTALLNDWRNKVLRYPFLEEVLWNGVLLKNRCEARMRLKSFPHDCFSFCRHTIEHTPERTLIVALHVNLPGGSQAAQSSSTPQGGTQVSQTEAPSMVQQMPTPIELDFLVGVKFDRFVAESICHIITDPRLDRNEFLSQRWQAYVRSCISLDEQEDGGSRKRRRTE